MVITTLHRLQCALYLRSLKVAQLLLECLGFSHVVADDEKIPKCSHHALYHARDIEEITIETPKSST